MHIIPAAGTASRFGGLPKYLLPSNPEGKSLLSLHIDASLRADIGEIRIVVHPSMFQFVSDLLSSKPNRIRLQRAETMTMTETIKSALQGGVLDKSCVITLPDTFNTGMLSNDFATNLSHLNLGINSLLLWKMDESKKGKLGQVSVNNEENQVLDVIDKDPNCNYPYFWGAISLATELIQELDINSQTISHNIKDYLKTGLTIRAIKSNSEYFDCGNFHDYKKMLEMNN